MKHEEVIDCDCVFNLWVLCVLSSMLLTCYWMLSWMCVWLWMLSTPCLIPCACIFYMTHGNKDILMDWLSQSPTAYSYGPTSFEPDCHVVPCWLVECLKICLAPNHDSDSPTKFEPDHHVVLLPGGMFEDLSLAPDHDSYGPTSFEPDRHVVLCWLVECLRIGV